MEKTNIEKLELQKKYFELKSIRKTAEYFNSTYQEIHFLIRFFKIPMRPPGNPILVPHRKYGQVLYKNGELVKDIEGRYIKQNGEKINI
jgi:hypothetical protein